MDNNYLTSLISERGDWYWPTHDVQCWNYMQDHSDLPDVLSAHVKERGVIVQAGGNAGFYVRKYAELFEVVYTFEPLPVNFLCLAINCDTSNVIKFQACVGDKPGLVSLGNYWANDDIGSTHVNGRGIFPIIRIDDLKLERCDALQLDTEGFEYFGLLGAKETIEKFKPVICVEWYQPWAQRYGVTLEMIEEFLFKFGYQLVTDHSSDRIYVVK